MACLGVGEPTNTAVWPTVMRTVSLQPQHYGDLTFGITLVLKNVKPTCAFALIIKDQYSQQVNVLLKKSSSLAFQTKPVPWISSTPEAKWILFWHQ